MKNKKYLMLFALILTFLLGTVVGSNGMEEIKAFLDYNLRITVDGQEFIAKDVNGNKLTPSYLAAALIFP